MTAHVFYLSDKKLRHVYDRDFTPAPDDYRYVVGVTDADRCGQDIFRVMNNVDGSPFELPRKLRCRSMSVGDVVLEIGKGAMVCDRIGWAELSAEVTAAFTAKVPGYQRDRACGRCGHSSAVHDSGHGTCLAPAENAGGVCDCVAFEPGLDP